MKMTLVLLLGASLSAAAQGTLIFANFGGGNYYPIHFADGRLVQAANGVLVDLYYGATSNTVSTPLGLKVQIQGNGLFTATAVGNMNPVYIPGFSPGDAIFVKVVAWLGGNSYQNGHLTGESRVFQVTRLGGGDIPTPMIPLRDRGVLPYPAGITTQPLRNHAS